MEHFTPYEWLLIDIANKGWDDKALYQDRLLWALSNINNLEDIKPEKNTAYQKAVLALRDTDNGIPSGHLVELDAIASGMSLLSVMTRCVTGMVNTGVISDGTRPDPYTKLKDLLGMDDIPRGDAKEALMQTFYAGQKTAKLIFGDRLPLFYKAAEKLAPRAYQMIDVLTNTWQADALSHTFRTPNHSVVNVRVWETKETKITVPNLDNRSFTFMHKVNQGKKEGLANCAK